MTTATRQVPDARPATHDAQRRGLRVALSLGDQAVVSVANFASTLVLGRVVGASELGVYGMALAGLLLACEAQHALVSTPHQVLLPRMKASERASFNGSALVHTLAFGSAIGLAAAAAAVVLDSATAWTLAAVAWAVLGRHFVRIYCFTTGRPGAACAVDAAAATLQIGGLLLLWQADRLTAVTAFFAIGLGNAAAFAGALAVLRAEFRPRVTEALSDLRLTWRLGRWLFVSGVLWTLGMHGYPWLVGAVRGAGEAGVWTACVALAALVNPLLLGMQNLIGPAVARRGADAPTAGFRRFVIVVSLAFAAAMLPWVAAAAYGGEWLLRVYGDTYAGSGGVVALVAVAMVGQALGFPASRGLFSINHARHDLYGNVLSLGILLTAGTWLVGSHGAAGAATTLVAGVFAGNLYRLAAFIRLAKGRS